MSRIAVRPIQIPQGVSVVLEKNTLRAKGSKGELSLTITPLINVEVHQDASEISIKRRNDSKEAKSQHGLMHSLIRNLLSGVNEGYSKQLEVNGVGFKVSVNGQKVTLNLGYSHDVNYTLPEGVNAAVDQNRITISGIDKQQVGQVAAEIRALRKPEPYKGKGIKYIDEYIIRKAGKAAAGGKE